MLASVRSLGRAREIARVFARYGFGEIVSRMGFRDEGDTDTVQIEGNSAQKFVRALQELGPTFVKLGQILSTRGDLIPAAWIKALSELQENVTPLTEEAVRRQLTAHYDDLPEVIFAKFGWEPLASASIGQVHAAKLHDGTDVVVKVQRPEVAKLIKDDIAVLRMMAQVAEATVAELQAFRPTGVVDEFERTITQETDFTKESRNANRFAEMFEDDDNVVVPKVCDELSGRTIMVMERLHGVKITDCEEIGCDPQIMAQKGIEMIFSMAFVHGFFHADPHPGNIWALEDNRIGLLDLGMAGSVMPATRDVLIDLMFAVVSEDADAIAEVLLTLSERPVDLNMRAFKRDVFLIYDEHVRGLALKDISVADLVNAAIGAGRTHNLVIPTDLSMLLKALATVEGVGKSLDPDLDIIAAARPFVLKIVSMRWGPDRLSKDALSFVSLSYELLRKLPRRLDVLSENLERGELGRLELPQIPSASEEIARSMDRVAYAVVIAALVFGSASIQSLPMQLWRGVPVLALLGYILAGALGTVVIVGPVTRRIWQRRRKRFS